MATFRYFINGIYVVIINCKNHNTCDTVDRNVPHTASVS